MRDVSSPSLVEEAVRVVVEPIGWTSEREGSRGRAHQGIAVAYQNPTARHRLPKPRGKDRRYRIRLGPISTGLLNSSLPGRRSTSSSFSPVPSGGSMLSLRSCARPSSASLCDSCAWSGNLRP